MMHPNKDTTPHELALPRSDDAETLHVLLETVPGFRGITTRDGKAFATFAKTPSPTVAREIVRRLR